MTKEQCELEHKCGRRSRLYTERRFLDIMYNKTNNEDDTHKDLPKTAPRTYEAICRNPNTILAELSAELGISERTIKSHFALLKKAGLIEQVGGKTYGHWEIIKED